MNPRSSGNYHCAGGVFSIQFSLSPASGTRAATYFIRAIGIVLEEQQKRAIQKAYSAFLASNQLTARPGQKQMIAEIARALPQCAAGGQSSGHPADWRR